jgi:hypothetical protein
MYSISPRFSRAVPRARPAALNLGFAHQDCGTGTVQYPLFFKRQSIIDRAIPAVLTMASWGWTSFHAAGHADCLTAGHEVPWNAVVVWFSDRQRCRCSSAALASLCMLDEQW